MAQTPRRGVLWHPLHLELVDFLIIGSNLSGIQIQMTCGNRNATSKDPSKPYAITLNDSRSRHLAFIIPPARIPTPHGHGPHPCINAFLNKTGRAFQGQHSRGDWVGLATKTKKKKAKNQKNKKKHTHSIPRLHAFHYNTKPWLGIPIHFSNFFKKNWIRN